MEDKILGLLGLMRRANALAIGTDNSADAVHAGKAKVLLLASDAADNARRKAENACSGRRTLLLPVHYSRAELSQALGVGDCSMAAVTEIGFANALLKALTAESPGTYEEAAAEIGRRFEKTTRRKKEKTARADSKRNGKRRTEG